MDEREIRNRKILKITVIVCLVFIILSTFIAIMINKTSSIDNINTEVGKKMVEESSSDVRVKLVNATTDSTTYTKGQTIKVNLQLEYVPNAINVLTFDLNYDRQYLKVKYIEDDGEYSVSGKNSWTAVYQDEDSDADYVQLTRTETYSELNKNICVIEFEVIKDIETTQINIENAEASGGAGNRLNVEDAVLTLGNSSQSHTVTYDYSTNGGSGLKDSAQNTDQVAENGQIDLTNKQAVKDGYEFVGWAKDQNSNTPLDNLQMGNEDVTLYAIFKKDLTVTYKWYNANHTQQTKQDKATMYNNDQNVTINLESITDTYIDENQKAWTKTGWTTDTSANTTSTFAEASQQAINANTTYYMLYQRVIKVDYDVNGGSSVPPTSQNGVIKANSSNITSIEGAKITISSTTPLKQGYTFANKWNEQNNGGGASYASSSQQTFTEDKILYAEWTANSNTNYTVKHFKQKPDFSYDENSPDKTENLQGETGTQVTATEDQSYLSSGYELDNQKSVKSGIIKGDGSLELKLYYSLKGDIQYKVRYYLEQLSGEYVEQTNDMKTLQGVVGQPVTAPTKTYVGYTQDDTNPLSKTTGNILQDGSLELKVYFKLNEYTVKFKNGDGTDLDTKTAKHGQTITPTNQIPTKKSTPEFDYTFEKWVDSQGHDIDLNNITGNIDAIPQFKETKRKYTVKFYADETKGQELEEHTVDYGTPAGFTGQTPTKEPDEQYSYEFEGWQDEDGNIVDVDNVTENKEVFPKFRQVTNKYTITFYDEDKNSVLGTSTVEYGQSATPPPMPTKESTDGYDYTFDKWVDDEGQAVDLSEVSANQNVYASYTKKATEYTITYENTYDAENANPTTYTVENEDIVLLPLEDREGMTFLGWYSDEECTQEVKSIITKNMENITLYAKWDIYGLYLKSQVYKIGFENIREYEKGDEYIYRVPVGTTLSEFIANCDTNGTITVYKKDGSELGSSELIGTGMTLKDVKDDQEINLTISVIGDANGNARLDTADLTVNRGNIYENSKLIEVVNLSMDIDENERISTKDLTLLRGALYEGKLLK